MVDNARPLLRATAPLRRSVARLPWERGLLLGVAAVVGIYAGIAAGLFTHSIRFVQLLLFRSADMREALFGANHREWLRLFADRLEHAHWHFEFAAIALLLLLAGFAVEALARLRLRVPLFQAHRLRSVALAGAFGLTLYYPLLLLDTFNRTFHPTERGLYGLLLEAPRWVWVLAPALGALAAGLLIRYVSPESSGHGVVEVIEAVHGERQLRGRVAVWKSLAAGLVIGSGGSAGREGPVVHLGGAVASSLGRSLALPRRHVSLLLACGAAAGISASFQAPLAGTLFALEIVLGDFVVAQFTPIVLAAVMATATSRALMGTGNDLHAVAWSLTHPSEIAIYLLLGLVAGGVGIIYVRSLRAAEALFAGHLANPLSRFLGRLWPEWRAALGGLLLGLLSLCSPRALGTGIESMNAALAGEMALSALCLALVFKLVATALTLGSGSPGGSFFPAVYLGAMLGAAFGHLVHLALPAITSSPESYAAVGMGAVVAGATAAPLTGVFMMFELTASYQIVLPLLVACGVSAALVHSVLGGSIYTLAARARGIVLHKARTSLRDLSVEQALERAPSLREDLPLAELVALLAATSHPAFPVVDAAGRPVGILSVVKARKLILEAGQGAALNLGMLALRSGVPALKLDDDLQEAVRRLAEAQLSEGLVVGDDEKTLDMPIGIISREGILEAWRRSAQPRTILKAREPYLSES